MSGRSLEDLIAEGTEGGKLMVEFQLKVLRGETGADTSERQRAVEWLSLRGPWGKPKEGAEAEKATSPAASVSTEQLLEALQKLGAKK